MDSKALHLILLTASVFAVASSTFTYGTASDSTGDKAARAIWRDKGSNDNRDYKFNTGYPAAYGIEEHHVGDGHTRGTYKDGGSLVDTHDSLGKSSKGTSDHHQGAKDATSNSDGYNQNYKHGYRHSHGYRRHHHHSNDKGRNGVGDGYRGHHRVRYEHDHDGRNDGDDRGCGHGGCKYGSSRYNDGFEFHYGDNGKGHNERNYEQNDEHSLGHGNNEGVDDHGPDYHYGFAQSGDNYGKDYPSFASDHHYRHREQDYDQADHRHGLIRQDH